MIKQRVVIAKLKTDDGLFEVAGPIGTELWINANSFEVKDYIKQGTGMKFKLLVVRVEDGALLPAEVFEYKSDFKILWTE